MPRKTLEILNPESHQGQFAFREDSFTDQGLIAADQVAGNFMFSRQKRCLGENGAKASIFPIARNLITEIPGQVMNVPVLINLGRMENDSEPKFPEASLGDETLPDITHPEGAITGNVE
jgi:hypothetical protein